jgi:hypothetical protein
MSKNLKTKSFCKWDKDDISRHINFIYELTAKPRFVCEKCARVARLKANVCKPLKFDKS